MAENQIAEISQLLAGEPAKKDDEVDATNDEIDEGEPLEEEGSTKKEEGAEEAGEDEEEDVSWSSILGVDESKIVLDSEGNFKGVKVKVDGKVSNVDLKTLVDGYQMARSTTQRSQQLASEKKEFEQQKVILAQAFQAKLNDAETLTKVLHSKFLSDYNNIDWARLRTENPAEYVATIQDFQTRQAGLQQVFANIQRDKQATQEQQKNIEAQRYQEFMQQQADAVLEKFPEWSNPAVATEAFTKMQSFVAEYGYSKEEFADLADARAIEIVQDAMRYRSGRKLSEAKYNKPVPKFQHSTSARSRGGSKIDRLISRAKKTGNKNDQVAAVSALISSR